MTNHADLIAALRIPMDVTLRDGAPELDEYDEQRKAAADRIEELEAKLAKAVEALTPSGDTKAEYAGEFHISVYGAEGEDGNEIWRKVPVDWTTIKAIMAAIKGRAAIAEINGGGDD